MIANPMKQHRLSGLDGSDTLGLMAALGLLRIASIADSRARLRWDTRSRFVAVLELPQELDPIDLVQADLVLWRGGHPALAFAEEAPPGVQDLKHPPADFRRLMRELRFRPEAERFVAAYGTGVTTDGKGECNKPTALHFCAGQQKFLGQVLGLRDEVTPEDFEDALFGPWKGRVGPKDLRWRPGSERLRALMGVDPSEVKAAVLPGANWLAFQALPLFPCVPIGLRSMTTTRFEGSHYKASFTWPIWSDPLSIDAIRTLLATPNLVGLSPEKRRSRGISIVFRSAILRSDQGYSNFASSTPC